MAALARLYPLLAVASLALALGWQGLALPPHVPAAFPIRFYQQVAGRVDGRSCPAYPVCSAYARQAIETHGGLVGGWLALDRLIHEEGDLQDGPWIQVAGRRRLDDPVERNAFWLHRAGGLSGAPGGGVRR